MRIADMSLTLANESQPGRSLERQMAAAALAAAFPRLHLSREPQGRIGPRLSRLWRSVRRRFYAVFMPKKPSRIELLELDIDLRLADLWREADDITEWNLEIVAAFMRAAYGKGYCDALTEESPGELCHEHGYRVPPRKAESPQT
jgi:hypothetical protein